MADVTFSDTDISIDDSLTLTWIANPYFDFVEYGDGTGLNFFMVVNFGCPQIESHTFLDMHAQCTCYFISLYFSNGCLGILYFICLRCT